MTGSRDNYSGRPNRGGPGGGGGGGGGGGRRRFVPRRKVCSFCVDNIKYVDWKSIDTLRRYVLDNGSIRSRQKTGTCAKHQRQLAVAIKRARFVALLPYTTEHSRISGYGSR
jgi:small subunit ribosomal protein S18